MGSELVRSLDLKAVESLSWSTAFLKFPNMNTASTLFHQRFI